jgi:hypothetical protein
MIDLAIATCASQPNLGPLDRGVVSAVAEFGIRATPLVWNDPAAHLDGAQAVLIQSTWDSHLHPQEFLAWARDVERRMPLFNPLRLLEWNVDKRYLQGLEQQGVPVTPTLWAGRAAPMDLRRVLEERGWSRMVLKPAVSAGANETHIFDVHTIDAAQAALDRLRAHVDVMVQPYLTAFETEGERSYVFFEGVFSHCVRRPPTLQSAQRSFADAYVIEPTAPELMLARHVLEQIEEAALYARVDVATDNEGVVRLQELELIEPCLFSALAPGAQQRFAEAIAARLAVSR